MSLKRHQRPSLEFSVASMADMVFLLLIFFLVTSSFVRTKPAIVIEFPESGASVVKEEKNAVTITADGRFFFDSEELEPKGSREQKIAAARMKVKEAIAKAKTKEDRVISLRVDKEVKHGDTSEISAEVQTGGGILLIFTETKK